MSKELIVTICPHCEYVSDNTHFLGDPDAVPENGDASVCGQCTEIAIFDDSEPRGVRKPTEEEYADIISEPSIKLARALIVIRNLDND